MTDRHFVKTDDVCTLRDFRYGIEASMLGLAPGEWPRVIDTDLGNKRPLRRISGRVVGNEVEAVTYRQQLGILSVTVWND